MKFEVVAHRGHDEIRDLIGQVLDADSEQHCLSHLQALVFGFVGSSLVFI